MVPVFVNAPPTYPDIVHYTSLRLEYIVDYVEIKVSDWVFVTTTVYPCHQPIWDWLVGFRRNNDEKP